MLQSYKLWSKFLTNWAIYGVQDSWRILIITNIRESNGEISFGERRVILSPQTLIIALKLTFHKQHSLSNMYSIKDYNTTKLQ